MSQEPKVDCPLHGEREPAYICQHLLASLNDGVERGLIWSVDGDNCYNAYCNDCDTMLERGGGQWTEELEEKARISIVCEGCMETLFVLNNQKGGK